MIQHQARQSRNIVEAHHPGLAHLVRRTLGLDTVSRLHGELTISDTDLSPFDSIARLLGLRASVTAADLERIPKRGPLVVVANHPFGGAEGILLASVLRRVRGDVKVLANSLLESIPELRGESIFVDPFDPAAPRNVSGLRSALRHLQQGGALITFPAGTVSHLQPKRLGIVDPDWNPTIARIARRAAAAVLPVFIPGRNSLAFQGAGLLHPALRTAMLPRELLKRRGSRIEFRIGSPVSAQTLQRCEGDTDAMRLLRFRTYAMRHRAARAATPATPRTRLHPLCPAVDKAMLAAEINLLGPEARLASQGELSVLIADAATIPCALTEIGRLREATFRAVGEGTGRAIDLDDFDSTYQHLFLWNGETSEIAGAYRVRRVDASTNPESAYTSSLFRFARGFFPAIGEGLELGRSFVRAEYQRSFAPLLLLWRGIGALIARDPECHTLFGPVSISADYSTASRALMARWLLSMTREERLGRLAHPRNPFRLFPDFEAAPRTIANVDELSDLVASLEPDGKGVPVLLRHYLRLGGRIAALNVDPEFSSVVDGLIVVDLRHTGHRTLSRYLGAEGAARFREHHAGPRFPATAEAS
jgi:putative hemolysin